ncbi:hypothetical protein [Streptomyces sp. 150FB]|uniref:hypothetical protein n=1 Tax=Streptomyces sp. 150FB TaxID=1576605 RepID=UPI001364BEA6|nr:hypothetical protein [Streptomyces sp. 150FB]
MVDPSYEIADLGEAGFCEVDRQEQWVADGGEHLVVGVVWVFGEEATGPRPLIA